LTGFLPKTALPSAFFRLFFAARARSKKYSRMRTNFIRLIYGTASDFRRGYGDQLQWRHLRSFSTFNIAPRATCGAFVQATLRSIRTGQKTSDVPLQLHRKDSKAHPV